MHKPKFWEQVLYQLVFLLVAAFVLIPIWGMAYLAFDAGITGWPTQFRMWPKEASLEVFQLIWNRAGQTLPFLGALKNSLVVSFGAALLSTGLGASMAYAFARFRFPGRKPGLFALLVGILLPPVALMTPFYVLLRGLSLQTTQLALIIVYTAFSMPFCIWNMRAAFQSIPLELEEAALIDGAGQWSTFWHVSLPLALPAIAIAALLAFLLGYSEFAMGWLFVQKPEHVTLAMAISGILTGSQRAWSWLSALSVMMSIPVVAVFLILRRALIDRMVWYR